MDIAGRGDSGARRSRSIILAGLLAGLVAFTADATAQDVGYEGPSFVGAATAPTETKPENKIWFNDGIWWGSLWSTPSNAFHVFRLDQRTHVWSDTGVLIESRPGSKSDALWTGTKLYVASHLGSSTGGSSGNSILILRYSYNAATDTYTADPGFPVTIGSFSTESLVIDRDSTGTVWAAWMQQKRVFFAHTIGGNDLSWTAPAVLPVSTSNVSTDDVCSLAHFGGNRIGVMWSDQAANNIEFAFHDDGQLDNVWTLETALAGESDDHVNLAVDSTGRVFATVKNVLNELKLLVRDGSGWSQYLITRGVDRFTRPIVLLDEEARLIHVYASGQDNGNIHEKTSSLDTIGFATGTGTVVLHDDSDPLVNNATSTKQNVDSTTGIVVLAHHETSQKYWHHSIAPAGLLVAAFHSTAGTGSSPLSVQFTDQSTGAPTSWLWSFGDGASSTAQHPVHVYTTPGTYTVGLTVTGPGGTDDEIRVAQVTVTPGVISTTFTAVADARVNEANPGSNAGTATELRVRLGTGSSYNSYVRFNPTGIVGQIMGAKVRLFCTEGSTSGGMVFPTSGAWAENTINWNNKPAATGAQLSAVGSITPNTWIEYDVGPAITGPGQIDFLFKTASSNSAFFSSREGANAPQLVIQTQPLSAPVADFTANTTNGAPPLTIQFSDLTTGGATAWTWDFGDGSGSNAQNPSHVYASAGSYTVSLFVAGPGGSDVATKLDFIHAVSDAPVADFSAAPTSGTAPLNVAFTDQSSGNIASWSWDFGDGSGSTIENPAHVYASAGTYTVVLTVTGAGGSDDETKVDLVHVDEPAAPVADFSATPTSGTAPLNVAFTDLSTGSVTSWSWDFGDGAGSTAQNPGHVYPDPGTFTVTLSVSGPAGSDGETKTSYITVNEPPPVADFSATPTSGTAPLNVAFTDQSTGDVTSWSWTFGDGGTSTSQNPAHVYNGTGSFTVTLTVSGAGGSDGETKTSFVSVTSPQAPVADFSGSPTSGAPPLSVEFTDLSTGDIESWSWSFGDGGTSTAHNPVHSYASAGTYTVSLTVSGPNGSDSEVKTGYVSVAVPHVIHTLLPVADARVNEASPTSRSGTATELRVRFESGGSYHSYLRFDLSGLGSVLSAKLRLFYSDGSNIGGLIFPTSSGWSESQISWSNKPAATGAQVATLGNVATGAWAEVDVTSAVTGSGLVSFLMTSSSSNSALFSSREGANPPQLIVETGAPQPPVASFTATPTSGMVPLTVAFTDTSTNGPTAWSWSFGDGGTSTVKNPAHAYTSPGTYTVTLVATNAGGNSTSVRTDLVTVSPVPPVQTLLPVADARVNESNPTATAGSATELRLRFEAAGSFQSYLRFNVPSLSGPVASAKLRLFCTDGSNVAGSVFPTTNTWVESTVNWNNKPAATGAQIASVGTVATGAWVEFDVTSAIAAGPVNFLLTTTSSNSCLYSSREGANPPQLVITTAAP